MSFAFSRSLNVSSINFISFSVYNAHCSNGNYVITSLLNMKGILISNDTKNEKKWKKMIFCKQNKGEAFIAVVAKYTDQKEQRKKTLFVAVSLQLKQKNK